jgi:phosphomannomutase
MKTLYEKVGRKYVPVEVEWDRETLKCGQFRMHYAYEDGGGMYFYDVTPDTAGFVAAAMIANKAMEQAIRDAAPPSPHIPTYYTKKQREIIERYRVEMLQAGGMLPDWWQHTTTWDIAKAGIDAVRNFKP